MVDATSIVVTGLITWNVEKVFGFFGLDLVFAIVK